MSWGSLLLTALNLILRLVQYVSDKQLLKAGEDAAVGKAAQRILETTAYGKELRRYVTKLPEAEADELWDAMKDA